MAKTRILLSLITSENDYQQQMAAAAQEAAQRLNVDLQTVFAENDPVYQSQQVLQAIQASGERPEGIVVLPISDTGLVQAAKAAAPLGIGWAIVNRRVDYIQSIRSMSRIPVFQVITDHVEIGRIQGRQLGLLAPEGGIVLYLQGPASASTAVNRAKGFNETKPIKVEVRSLRANWTQEGARNAVNGWLRLSTSRALPVQAVVAQNDAMAMGARKAFEQQMTGGERDRWLRLPFTGCDGVPQAGQAWVKSGFLRATVIHPVTAGLAIEMLVSAMRNGTQPAETTVLSPSSYPELASLSRK